MEDERLERLAGLLQMGWGQGLCEEQRLTGSGGQPAALWGEGSLPSRGSSKKSSLRAFQRHSATVVAVSIFHCQKRYSTSVIYIDFLVFFSL